MTSVGGGRVLRLRCTRALVGGRLVGPVELVARGDRIEQVVPADTARGGDGDVVDLVDGVLSAGLVDVQNNGSFGVDVASADAQGWSHYRERLAAAGTTAVQPTLITAPLPALHEAAQRYLLASALSRGPEGAPLALLVGMHAEGPFLSPRRSGMHPVEHLVGPTSEALSRLLDGPLADALGTVTLAPELPGALAAVERLAAAGIVVSLGHTDADAATASAAADAGASMATHLFNAMRPLHHREPGVVGQVLTDERFTVGVVGDGLHVDPLAVRVAMRAAPGRVALVTDAVVTAGLGPGAGALFGQTPVRAAASGLAVRTDGTIAGAGITLAEGVRRLVDAGLDAADVLHAATAVPAAGLRRSDVGVLAAGSRADLVWWAPDWTVRRVWVGGEVLGGPA